MAYTFPPVREHVFANGLTVLVVIDREQPVCELAVQFPCGRFDEPEGLEGVAELAFALMQTGTESLAPRAFAERFEGIGSMPFVDVGEEHTVAGCRFLSTQAHSAGGLFWEMLTRPRLDSREFKRLRREMLSSIQAERADSQSLVHKHFYAHLLGRGHPAGRFLNAGSIRRITMPQVRSLLGRCCRPDGATVVLGGDYPDCEIREMLSLFEGWERRGTTTNAPAFRDTMLRRRVRIVDRSDLEQTYIVAGCRVPGELDPARNELAIANHILGGGGFSSRLMERVRTKHGAAYHVSSQIHRCRQFGVLSVTTSTEETAVAEVLGTVKDVFGELRDGGVTREELDKALDYVCGNMVFRFEGLPHVVDRLLWLRQYDRPRSYLERFADTMRQVSLDGVNGAIKQYFRFDDMPICAVGRRRGIEAALRQYGNVQNVSYRSRVT